MKPRSNPATSHKRTRSAAPSSAVPPTEDQLRRLLDNGLGLAELREIDRLLDYAIDRAVNLCAAERGCVILIAADGSASVNAMRGLTQDEIDQAGLVRDILNAIAHTRQPVTLPVASETDRASSTRSGVCVPLINRSEVIGAIYIDRSSSHGNFSATDSSLLVLFARQVVSVLDNLQVYNTVHEAHELLEERASLLEQRLSDRTAELQKANLLLAQRAVQLETHSQVAQQITSLLDLDNLLTQIVQFIQASFGYYFVGVWLVADHKDAVVLRAGTERTSGSLHGLRIPMETSSIVVSVCRTGQHRLVNDVTQAADYYSLREALPDTRSELALPLNVGEQVLGALDIQSDQRDRFSYDDRIVLQILADQIAVAIRNAQLYALEQGRRHLAEALEQTGRELSSSLDMGKVPNRILEQLAVVVPFERGSVLLQEEDVPHIVAQLGFPQRDRTSDLRGSIQHDSGDIYQQLLTTARPVIVDDVTLEPSWRQADWLPLNRSWLGVPLVINERVIGMISLTRRAAADFVPDDATVVSAFAGQAAIALENARLYAEIRRLNEQLEQMVQARTEELNKAYETLEHLDKTKSDFIEVAAHELRTPLTVIKGYAQLLDLDPLLSEESDLKLMLTGIVSGTVRLQEVINNMLDVTKIDSEALHMHRMPMRVTRIIRNLPSDFKAALRDRQLQLSIGDLDNLPAIQADSEMLYKVFYHLTNNAIKYTPDGGSITITGQTIAEGNQPLAIELVVSDTGIGIDPKDHELIFEKFYQTGEVSFHSSGRTKFKGGGPGLGLAIAKGIVLAHDGRIWVESSGYDEARLPGSQFHVLLPVMA